MVDSDALKVDGQVVEPDTFTDALDPLLLLAHRLARAFLRNQDDRRQRSARGSSDIRSVEARLGGAGDASAEIVLRGAQINE